MSEAASPTPLPPAMLPSRSRRSPLGWLVRILLFLFLACSVAFNILFLGLLILFVTAGPSRPIIETFHSGKMESKNKIAVVRIEGVLMEGLTGFAQKQIDHAATDAAVKAVVVRINSPGGTITSSDDLHHRLTQLRDGNALKKAAAKPLVVSMASLAASGGYYIAMPAKTLFAEPSTATGSIGVYAALPDATELSKKIGFGMRIIKAGEVKDSGSPFHEMTPHERELWQDMVDHSYLRFLEVVEQGRPALKGKLQEDISVNKSVPIRDDKTRSKHVQYVRYLADGGIFMANDAQKYGLVDRLGYLEDAVQAAGQAAGLGEDYKVVTYEKQETVLNSLLGIKAQPPPSLLDPNHLAAGAVPRLWYLSPQADLAGVFAAMGKQEGN
ncbi:MAG: S49 family peptidase [Planctomycetota bacterium]|nr:MAG: S49 family peptidase [Planctomycetota bacterium]